MVMICEISKLNCDLRCDKRQLWLTCSEVLSPLVRCQDVAIFGCRFYNAANLMMDFGVGDIKSFISCGSRV